MGHHTLVCFADITIDGSEILYAPRAYTWLWNMKFQTFNFPLICMYLLEAKQDIYMDTRDVCLNIIHIPPVCITFVNAGGMVYFRYSATNLFSHIQLILRPQKLQISQGIYLDPVVVFFWILRTSLGHALHLYK